MVPLVSFMSHKTEKSSKLHPKTQNDYLVVCHILRKIMPKQGGGYHGTMVSCRRMGTMQSWAGTCSTKKCT